MMFLGNHRAVFLAVFNYISLLRSAPLPARYQEEQSAISHIRFRFAEKTRPEDFALSTTRSLEVRNLPRELVFKGRKTIEKWDDEGKAAAEASRVLDKLRIDQSRTLLMARGVEYEKWYGPQDWRSEPVYGTQYRIDRYENELLQAASHSITCTDMQQLTVALMNRLGRWSQHKPCTSSTTSK